MSGDAPMRVTGPEDFTRGMRALERVAGTELDDAYADVMEDLVLPAAQEYTPVGDGRSGTPGRLRDGTRVVKGSRRFVNRQPHANPIHWGRKRRGVIKAARFLTRAADDRREAVEREMGSRLNALLERFLP